MILSFILNFSLGNMTPVARAKLTKYLFGVFLVFFFSACTLTRGLYRGRASVNPVSFPWITSFERLPKKGADEIWIDLRFLNYEVLGCRGHSSLPYPGRASYVMFLYVFTSNLLTGTIGFIAGLKYQMKKLRLNQSKQVKETE